MPARLCRTTEVWLSTPACGTGVVETRVVSGVPPVVLTCALSFHGTRETAISLDPLFQNHLDRVACRFPNGFADFCLYRQHMRSVTHSHKRTSKWMTINLAPDFNETASTKELY
jgi:hypothetical protein